MRRAVPRIVTAAVLAVAVGCGGGGETLRIVISGSSTVEPIASDVAERFSDDRPEIAMDLSGPGTGDGFELFCAGETDVSNASRPIKDEEAAACVNAGIDYVELKIAIDGLAVITSPANDAVACLSFPQLYALLGPESEGFARWSDANDLAEEVGGEGDLPDLPLEVTAPGEESGTYDSFTEIVFDDIFEARKEAGVAALDGVDEPVARLDYISSPNDNVIMEGITGNATSLGWVGVAFADANPGKIKKLAVDAGDGCVENTSEAIADGRYPIARDLFVYVSLRAASKNRAVRDFVDFLLSDEGLEAVPQAGYVPLPAAELEATRQAWKEAKPS